MSNSKSINTIAKEKPPLVAPIVFYYKSFYPPKGYYQPFVLDDHVPKKDRELYLKHFEEARCFIAAFKKLNINEVESMDDIVPLGRLIDLEYKTITFDHSLLFSLKITDTKSEGPYFGRVVDEVKILNYDKEKRVAEYTLSPIKISDEERASILRTQILKILADIFNKNGYVRAINEFYYIQKHEELINSIYTYLILVGKLAGLESSEQIIEFFSKRDVCERYEFLQKYLEEMYFSYETYGFPLSQVDSSGSIQNKDSQYDKYEKAITKITGMKEDIKDELLQKAKYLRFLGEGSTKASMQEYLDTVINIPWGTNKKGNFDLPEIRKTLEKNVFGLNKAKERCIQYIAVDMHKKGNKKGSVLCLVGPPGVGKTLFAQSLAEAMGRELGSIALGGMNDVTILRGQRKGWVGAEPGQLIKTLIRTQTMNPIIVLDEIDKITGDRDTQIQSALLEILDPNQNHHFRDAFLDIPVDLSNVLFVASANDLSNISPPLKDRLDIIELEGYSPFEKLKIAKDYIIPKTAKNLELNESQIELNDSVITKLVENNKREPGMRGIEKNIQELARKYLVEYLESGIKKILVTVENLQDYIDMYVDNPFDPGGARVGAVNILWVSSSSWYGGRGTLQIQVVPGESDNQLTGSLQDVFKESVDVSLGYLRSHAEDIDLDSEFLEKKQVLLHAPETAVKKDGPSAGMAITCGIYSALKGLKIPQGVAMTGEIDLEGNILKIGGLKSKLAGGYQAGIKKFIVPKSNIDDYKRIDDEAMLKDIDVQFVENIEETFKLIFEPNKQSSKK